MYDWDYLQVNFILLRYKCELEKKKFTNWLQTADDSFFRPMKNSSKESLQMSKARASLA